MYSDHFLISAPTGGIHGSEQSACVSVDSVCKEVSKDNASVAKESIVVPVSVNEEVPHTEKNYKEVAGDPMKVSDPDNEHGNVSKKKSYASVVSIVRENQYSTLFHLIRVLII